MAHILTAVQGTLFVTFFCDVFFDVCRPTNTTHAREEKTEKEKKRQKKKGNGGGERKGSWKVEKKRAEGKVLFPACMHATSR